MEMSDGAKRFSQALFHNGVKLRFEAYYTHRHRRTGRNSTGKSRHSMITRVAFDSSNQVNHVPMLVNLSDYFQITYFCDVSKELIAHVSRRVPSARTTTDAREVCSSSDVDAVLICSATAFHPEQCILALEHNKWVLVEKPIALTHRDVDAIIKAEGSSRGKVFVGYQRRYAEAFLDAIEEVKGLKIDYVRVRGECLHRKVR